MRLALFDLDNTLLKGDSDYAWGQFLVANELVDGDEHSRAHDLFHQQYREGRLDIDAFLKFQLEFLKHYDDDYLHYLRSQYLEQYIKPMLSAERTALVEMHRDAGDYLVIITATNDFLTAPIAEWFAVDQLLATKTERKSGRYTGNYLPPACLREGKVIILQNWLKGTRFDLADSYFYSDSYNDVPLLKLVDHPVVVDPDEELRRLAEEETWPIID